MNGTAISDNSMERICSFDSVIESLFAQFQLIPSLKNFGNPINGNYGDNVSTLAKHSDITLNLAVDRKSCSNNLAPRNSSLATTVMDDALAVASIKVRDIKPDIADLRADAAPWDDWTIMSIS